MNGSMVERIHTLLYVLIAELQFAYGENKIESLQSAQVDRQVQTTTVATTTIPKGEGESSA